MSGGVCTQESHAALKAKTSSWRNGTERLAHFNGAEWEWTDEDGATLQSRNCVLCKGTLTVEIDRMGRVVRREKSNAAVGETFGRLTVLELLPKRGSSRMARVRCECGTEKPANLDHVRRGNIRSCGCLAAETKPALTHGMTKSHEFMTWHNMRNRCENPKNSHFARYGARGIRVCDRWQSFSAFFADMGPRPAGHQIDRIDNDGDYEPGNCRWATIAEQARNRSNNIVIEFGPVVGLADEWAEAMGIKPATVYERLSRGMTPLEALTAPLRRRAS